MRVDPARIHLVREKRVLVLRAHDALSHEHTLGSTGYPVNGSLFGPFDSSTGVGREAECNVTYAGRTAKRKALLETDEILVRGEPRIAVKRADITKAEAKGGSLLVRWNGGEMSLALGAHAEKWAKDIANPKTRLDKLGVKPGHKVALVGVTDKALAGETERAGAEVSKATKELDLVFLQVDTPKDLAKLANAAARIAPAGGVWVLTPRGVEGLKDTDVMKAGKAAGLVDVKVVRFSETHSANKFVVPKSKR